MRLIFSHYSFFYFLFRPFLQDKIIIINDVIRKVHDDDTDEQSDKKMLKIYKGLCVGEKKSTVKSAPYKIIG